MLRDSSPETEHVMVRLLPFSTSEFCCDNFGTGGFPDEKKKIQKKGASNRTLNRITFKASGPFLEGPGT